MKIIKIGEPKVIISNPMSKHNYFAWPTVARLKNGKIGVVCSGFRLKHVCPFGKTVISFSEDEGESYSLPTPVIDTPLDDRDGGLLPFGESGVIVTSFNNGVAEQRWYMNQPWLGDKHLDYIDSYLKEITPEDEKKYLGMTFRVSHDNGTSFGELYKSPVTSPHGPISLSDGSIIWVGTKREGEKYTICSYTLNPENGEMSYLGEIEDIYYEGEKLISCEPHAIELYDGSILCHIRAQGKATPERRRTFTTYQSISRDGGKSWSKPEIIVGREGGAPAHLIRHSSGVLISAIGYRLKPFGIKLIFSRDEGKTWSEPYDLYSNLVSDDIGYPSTVELSDGSLLTVFYSRPEEGAPCVIMQQRWKMEGR